MALRRAVRGVDGAGGEVLLRHDDGDATEARRALFCAGARAERAGGRGGAPADPRIVPFRGAYLQLRPGARHLVRGLIYPVPDPALPFLGVHLTRHVDGRGVARARPRCSRRRARRPAGRAPGA